MKHIINTSVAEIKLLDHDFIRIEYKPGSHVDLAELEENLGAYKQLVGNKKFYLVSIVNSDTTISERARNYWTTAKRSNMKIAEGFVIKDLGHRLIATFVMKFQPPGHTLKFFDAEKKAVEWINSLRTKMTKKKGP